jgi:hypothetical protein
MDMLRLEGLNETEMEDLDSDEFLLVIEAGW